MAEDFVITFSPYVANTMAQLTTVATVALLDGEVLWQEPVIVDVRQNMLVADVELALAGLTSGFGARVNAILLARSLQGTMPKIR